MGGRESTRAILARIDERTLSSKDQMDRFIHEVRKHYVRKDIFEPVKNIVFGLVGVILLAVAGAIVTNVVGINSGGVASMRTQTRQVPASKKARSRRPHR